MKDNFRETILQIVAEDLRYHAEAYEFISEAINYTAENLGKRASQNRHINGKQLLEGIADYAIMQFGPMASHVLRDWGITTSTDIGNVVFNMVNRQLLRASDNDSIKDFENGLDFDEVFNKPFTPKEEKRFSPTIIA